MVITFGLASVQDNENLQYTEISTGTRPIVRNQKYKVTTQYGVIIVQWCIKWSNAFPFFSILDAVNCCAVMSTNMVAFLLLNNHRKVCKHFHNVVVCTQRRIESGKVLILLYLTACICSRVQRLKNFVHPLNGYMEKSLLVEGIQHLLALLVIIWPGRCSAEIARGQGRWQIGHTFGWNFPPCSRLSILFPIFCPSPQNNERNHFMIVDYQLIFDNPNQ